jgi:hypothetical protein
MDIQALIRDSLKQGLILNAVFFLLFGRRLQRLAAHLRMTGEGKRKQSPFVYNLR